MKQHLILALAVSSICLAAEVAAPNPGFVRYSGLAVASVLGVPGNLVVGNSAFGPADAAAFSNRYGLLAKSGTIQLVERNGAVLGSTSYRGATPLLNLANDPASAIVWLPDEHALLLWDHNHFARVVTAEALAGVSSVSMPVNNRAHLLVTNPDRTVSAVVISLSDGSTLSSALLPGVRGPAFQFGAYLVWADEQGLEVENASGMHHVLPLPAAEFTAEPMSESWAHLTFASSGTHWALHLDRNQPSLSMLPVPVMRAAR